MDRQQLRLPGLFKVQSYFRTMSSKHKKVQLLSERKVLFKVFQSFLNKLEEASGVARIGVVVLSSQVRTWRR